MPEDILSSGIFFEDQRSRNSLLVNQIPSVEHPAAQEFLPFYLYRIPRRALSDLICGRLVLLVLLNPGRIAAALEADGFQVTDRTGRGDLSDESFIVAAEVTDPAGNPYAFEFRGMPSYINEVVYEFKSIHYIVEVARQMRDVTQATLIGRTSEPT